MVQKGDGSVQQRIERSWKILEKIQQKGKDTGKLKESLIKIEKVSKAAPEKDLERAISKFEDYLDRLVTQIGIEDEEKADAGEDSSEEQVTSQEETAVKPEENQEPTKDPTPPSQQEVRQDPDRQQEATEPAEPAESDQDKDEEDRPSAEKDLEPVPPAEEGENASSAKEGANEIPDEMEEAPQSPSLEDKEEESDVKADIESEVARGKLVEDLDREARSLGGDTSGIQPHIKAMKDALEKNDTGMFDQYWKICYDWLSQYLMSLAPSYINDMIASIRETESLYLDIGKQERLDGKIPDITAIMAKSNSSDINDMVSSLKELKRSVELIQEDSKNLAPDLIEEMKDKRNEMKSLLSRVVDEGKKTSFNQRIEKSLEGAEENTIATYARFRELYKDVTSEAANAERRKFEKILQSVEPMIQRISDILGEESEEHVKLVREKDHLLSKFSSDIKGAMEGMEGLLDQAANILADLEESRTQTLEQGIQEIKDRMENIPASIDTNPVRIILEKSEKAMEDNDLELCQTLLEKAQNAFQKTLNISIRKQAETSLNEVLSTRNELINLSIDVTPLDEPLEKASKALSSGDMETFDSEMETLKEKLSFMRREELRVEYQKLMIMIMNEMKSLRDQGVDVEQFENGLEDVKDLFLARNDKASVEKERSLLKQLRNKKISLAIGERLDNAMATLKEAEGLLIETEGSKRMMELAKEKMESGDVEESLDLLIRAQVELEERMTRRTFSAIEKEIRDLWDESRRYGLELEDLEPDIQEAYNIAEDGKYKEAMEHLYRLRDNIEKEVRSAKSTVIIEELGNLIKSARSIGLKIATFKAAHTKAKVLMDAGDVDSVIDLVEKQISNLKDRIENRKTVQSSLDELRGRMIGLDVKVKKLVDAGISVGEIREKMTGIRDLIETNDIEAAESEIEKLEKEIASLSMSVTSSTTDSEPELEEAFGGEGEEIDPELAKSKLFSLVADIRKEMKIRNTQGKATGEIKRDIETIQNLVIKKEYVKAYNVATECLNRIMV